MNKTILFNQEARDKLRRGINKLADAVKVTLGPEGKTVILASYKDNTTKITKDGVSVAREVFLEDRVENVGAQIAKQVAIKTSEDAGDGTTTATVLAQSLIEQCIDKDLKSSFFKELNASKDKVLEHIKSQSKPISITDREQIINVAAISANNDRSIGEIIAEAVIATGISGIVTAEAGNTFETKINVTQGLNFDSGFMSPLFINNLDRMNCELDDVCIFLYDDEISRIQEILPQVNFAVAKKKSLLIIAPSVTGEAMNLLLSQKNMGRLKCAAVKSPGFGDYRKPLMLDIATVTGGIFIEHDKVTDFTELTDQFYGYAQRVVITKDETTIMEGKSNAEKVNQRVKQIETQMATLGNEYEINLMKQRIAKMIGGVAVIKVGGHSEIEILEKKDRIEDAIFAVKAALQEGIVEGGGIAYLRAMEVCDCQELKVALRSPFIQIAENAGTKKIDALWNNITQRYMEGFNAKTGMGANMYEAGIIDPAKVTRVALENAVSIATTFLSTECIIVENE